MQGNYAIEAVDLPGGLSDWGPEFWPAMDELFEQRVEWRAPSGARLPAPVGRFQEWCGVNLYTPDYELGLRYNQPQEILRGCAAWIKAGDWLVIPARETSEMHWLWVGGNPLLLRDFHYLGHNTTRVGRSLNLDRILRMLRKTVSVHLGWVRNELWLEGLALGRDGSAILVAGPGQTAIAESLQGQGLELLEDPALISNDGATRIPRPIATVLLTGPRVLGPVVASSVETQAAAEELVQGIQASYESEVLHVVRWALASARCYRVEGDGSKFTLESLST